MLMQVLAFLDGSELEKCLYVSQNWCNIIKIYRNILPKRIFGLLMLKLDPSITQDEHQFFLMHQNNPPRFGNQEFPMVSF